MTRVTFTVKVDEGVANDFREYVQETKGQIRGELGRETENALREYMDNDRLTRVENRLDDIPDEVAAAVVRELEAKKKNSADSSSDGSDGPSTTTERRLNEIASRLPPNTTVSAEMLETPIENVAGSSRDTIRKYKRLLQTHGHIIRHPNDSVEEFFTSKRTFALFCENEPRMSAELIESVNERLVDVFGDGWYLDALPDDYIAGNDLKAAAVGGISVGEYRERNNMSADGRGFQ